jgi:hypothetical protein
MTTGEEMLTPREAARRLGVTTATLYGWLGLSRRGLFVLRGTPVMVAFFQTGSRGQGRIHIEQREVHRLRELMRVPVNRSQPVAPLSHRIGLLESQSRWVDRNESSPLLAPGRGNRIYAA